MDVDAWHAGWWGLVAGSSFLIGGAIGLRARPSERAVGVFTGFGAGALLGAVAFKLVDEAGRLAGGTGRVGYGLILGTFLSLLATGHWRSTPDEHVEISFRSLAVTVVPEAVVIVGALLGGHGMETAVIASVFVCGVPEALRATEILRARGVAAGSVLLGWSALMVVCAVSAWIAYALLDGASEGLVAFVLATAGGVVLTELSTELIPEARELSGWLVGPAVVVGFGVVFRLVELG